jgi:hypothetical protein
MDDRGSSRKNCTVVAEGAPTMSCSAPIRAWRWTLRVLVAGQSGKSRCRSFTSFPHLPHQQQSVVHTQFTHCKYNYPPLPSANIRVDSPQANTVLKTPFSNPITTQNEESPLSPSSSHRKSAGLCDTSLQFTAASARALPALRSSPLRLDPQASHNGAKRLPLHLAHCTQHAQYSFSPSLTHQHRRRLRHP